MRAPPDLSVCALDAEPEPVLRLSGRWRLERASNCDAALAALIGPVQVARLRIEPRPLVIDGSALESIDTAGASIVLHRLALCGLRDEAIVFRGFAPSHRRVFELVRTRMSFPGPSGPSRVVAPLHRLGRATAALGALLAGHIGFLGVVVLELGRVVARPRVLRRRELFAQLGQVCVSAIPVILLVTFLIGTIVAYLLGQQAEQYGANIFVVDGVALGMVREFSPLIVATIVAGRSGAAFTAQLGTMRMTEEIDAIRTLGLSPEQVLVIPRVLALVLALPLLVFLGDLAGMAGGMLVSDLMLDLTPATFVERVQSALRVRHYLIGLAKAPVFALFIAVIGCRMGLAVSRDTRSVGINTTSTVVQSIVAVILLDAVFAVLLQELRL